MDIIVKLPPNVLFNISYLRRKALVESLAHCVTGNDAIWNLHSLLCTCFKVESSCSLMFFICLIRNIFFHSHQSLVKASLQKPAACFWPYVFRLRRCSTSKSSSAFWKQMKHERKFKANLVYLIEFIQKRFLRTDSYSVHMTFSCQNNPCRGWSQHVASIFFPSSLTHSKVSDS